MINAKITCEHAGLLWLFTSGGAFPKDDLFLYDTRASTYPYSSARNSFKRARIKEILMTHPGVTNGMGSHNIQTANTPHGCTVLEG